MRQARRLTLFLFVPFLLVATLAQAQGLIPRTTAARYGLTRSWFAQVGSPQVTGRLDHVNYDEGMLLIQSSRGMITALDAETGRTLWNTQVGTREGSCTEPAANKDFVVVLNGSTLYVLDRKDGGILWQKRTSGAPGAGPGVTATHAFVPMTSGLMEGYDLAAGDHQTPWNYKSTGRILTPPMTTPLTVSWTTERGYFYVADPSGEGIKYRLESGGAMHSRPAAWSPMVYATSVDGLVYGINEVKGDIKWKFSVGQAIYKQPVALGDRVFVVPEFGGMYCLDAATGDQVWHNPSIDQFVSASPTRIYAADALGNLAILDAESGGLLGTMPMSGLTKKQVNSYSDRIFLVDNSCVVQCLHESQLLSPSMHTPPKPEELGVEPTKKAAKPETDEAPPAEEMPADDPGFDEGNPFDAPPADDGEGGNPFDVAPAGDDDNPFG